MKILTWNLERPNNNPKAVKNTFIIDLIAKINPDLIFLTETNSSINFEGYFSHKSSQLPELHENHRYKSGENRITIFSRFPITNVIETYDPYTAICCRINSGSEALVLYGSMIGAFEGRDAFFKNDLENQKFEIENLAKQQNLIFSGDLNIAFSGIPYPSQEVIYEMTQFFKLNALQNITGGNENSALHIIASKEILKSKKIKQEMIEIDTHISDHNLVLVEIQ